MTHPFTDSAEWLRPRVPRKVVTVTPQDAAILASLRRWASADDEYLREHTLGYQRIVRNADGSLDWERGPDGAPVFRANGESAAGRELVNRKLRAQRPEVLAYRAHRRTQSQRARKPRADAQLARIVQRLAKRDATAKELWPELRERLDAYGCRPGERGGRIEYIDAAGRARRITLATFANRLSECRKSR